MQRSANQLENRVEASRLESLLTKRNCHVATSSSASASRPKLTGLYCSTAEPSTADEFLCWDEKKKKENLHFLFKDALRERERERERNGATQHKSERKRMEKSKAKETGRHGTRHVDDFVQRRGERARERDSGQKNAGLVAHTHAHAHAHARTHWHASRA